MASVTVMLEVCTKSQALSVCSRRLHRAFEGSQVARVEFLSPSWTDSTRNGPLLSYGRRTRCNLDRSCINLHDMSQIHRVFG